MSTPKRKPAAAINYRALAELRYQIRVFLSFSEQAARAAGIEPQQHQLLLALKGLDPEQRPSVGMLASRLLLKHHTVVGLLDRLEAEKLVARKKSERDGREILIEITPRGERLLTKLSLAHSRELSSEGGALLEAMQTLVKATKR